MHDENIASLKEIARKKVNISYPPSNIQRFLDYIKTDEQFILVEWELRIKK